MSQNNDVLYADLLNAIEYRFQNMALLECALTHSSTGEKKNYERLEFLGDRVLGLALAQMLYVHFPDEAEGGLAKRLAALAQGSFLAKIAEEISLGQYIRFSEGERQSGGADNENILSDVFESMIGAMYLDGGFNPCFDLIKRLWASHLHEMTAPPQHPKTGLQEWAQSRGLPLPLYEVIQQSGPDHAPVFTVQVVVQGYPPLRADGRSRQEAEKQAALSLFNFLEGKT